ncbi:acetoin utilization protein AcuC, partial [Bacillus cereus]
IEAWKGQAETELPLTWEDPDNMYKPIPRKPEIEEKNALTVAKSLEIIRNNMTKSLY